MLRKVFNMSSQWALPGIKRVQETEAEALCKYNYLMGYMAIMFC